MFKTCWVHSLARRYIEPSAILQSKPTLNKGCCFFNERTPPKLGSHNEHGCTIKAGIKGKEQEPTEMSKVWSFSVSFQLINNQLHEM